MTMGESLARLIKVVGVAPETALRMSSTNPATLMGKSGLSGVLDRDVQDLLLLDRNWNLAGTAAAFAEGLAA